MAMNDLWIESYRPHSLNGYVFRDPNQKAQVEQWVQQKSIPHLHFSGAPGTGKCLLGSEDVLVKIDLTTVSVEQIDQLAVYAAVDSAIEGTYEIPIRTLFQILEINNISHEIPVKISTKVEIASPTGWAVVNAFVKKKHQAAKYTFDREKLTLSCSTKHIVFENGIAKTIDQCESIDTIAGPVTVVDALDLGVQELYDVALDNPHQYVTPNGIIHHNTTLAKILVHELGVNELDFLEINASRTNSIDDVRNKIVNFVQMIPFGEFKVVLLDECLHEDTKVVVLRDGYEQAIAIKNISNAIDLVKSYNVINNRYEYKPFELFYKGSQEAMTIELATGDKFTCTLDHKWYVQDKENVKVVKASELVNYQHILSPTSNTLVPIEIANIELLAEHVTVYDLGVDDNHNFFIKDKTEVLTHNCDFLSPNAQAALRGVFEEYHSTARFILTSNYPQRIIPALHSRCQGFHIEKVDQTEFTARVAEILINESVDFDLDTLDTIVKATYPDLRKCINTVQMNSMTGKLTRPDSGDTGQADYRVEMVELFKQGKITEARKLLCSQARPEEMEDIYKWMYSNISLLGSNDQQQDQAILIIKQALVDHTICADAEINLAACLIRLARNMET